jgi:hypothetical protein
LCSDATSRRFAPVNETVLSIAAIVTAPVAGLAGVLVGAWTTSGSQRRERKQAFLSRQLDEFYSPMLGMRELILAKSASRERVSQAAGVAWRRLIEGYDRQQLIQIEKDHAPGLQQIIDDNNRQLFEELLPLYRKMVEHFSSHLGLAEASTNSYFGAFVHYVETWNRAERKTLPAEVLAEIGHNEDDLWPFYKDLADNLARLQLELKKG